MLREDRTAADRKMLLSATRRRRRVSQAKLFSKYAGMEDMMLNSVFGEGFKVYGRVLENIDISGLLEEMEHTPLPDDVIYVPSDEKLERLDVYRIMSDSVYGQMPVQIGYCNGHNQYLNALEYHRSSEINVAVTDMILLLGRQQDIGENYTYDTSKVEAFMVPKGTVVEMYATTLHYAPCGVNGAGFKCVVVLPRGTNYDLKSDDLAQKVDTSCNNAAGISEDRLLAATNKWLIAHPDAGIEGAYCGLEGENICC